MPIEKRVRKAAEINRQLQRRQQKPREVQAGDAPIRIGADTGRIIVRQTVKSTPRIVSTVLVELTNPDLTSLVAGSYSSFMKSSNYLQLKFKRYSRKLLVGDLNEIEDGLDQHFTTQKERLERYVAFYRSRTKELPVRGSYQSKNRFELSVETKYSTDLVEMIRIAQECIECLDELLLNSMLPIPGGRDHGVEEKLSATDDYQKRVEKTLQPIRAILSIVRDTANTVKVNIGDVNRQRIEAGAEALGPEKKAKGEAGGKSGKAGNHKPLSKSSLKQKRREKRESQAQQSTEEERFARETEEKNSAAAVPPNEAAAEAPAETQSPSSENDHFARETAEAPAAEAQKTTDTMNAGSESNAEIDVSRAKRAEPGSEPNAPEEKHAAEVAPAAPQEASAESVNAVPPASESKEG